MDIEKDKEDEKIKDKVGLIFNTTRKKKKREAPK